MEGGVSGVQKDRGGEWEQRGDQSEASPFTKIALDIGGEM